MGWLSAFLKIYISVLQQASDLDDTVEEKLLVGDRPKQSNDPDSKLPWKERLSKQSQDELEEARHTLIMLSSTYISDLLELQLTPDELSFFNYVTAVADWLEPYHNYTRPSPAAVLAEAAKQTSAKSSTKGVQLNLQNGSTTNGHTKKEMEAPPLKDAPEVIPKFFDGIFELAYF